MIAFFNIASVTTTKSVHDFPLTNHAHMDCSVTTVLPTHHHYKLSNK